MKHIKSNQSASYDVTIIQTIPADQLEALQTTYRFMLDAVTDALNKKRKAEKMSARIIKLGKVGLARYNRRCLKIACLMRRGYSAPEISILFGTNIGSKSTITRMAMHGRALYKSATVSARKNFIMKCYCSGIGVRESARMMPEKLGTCSPGYASKIIKAAKLKDQTLLPFPLSAV